MSNEISHEYWRNNQTWMANSVVPIKTYVVRDMSTPHILNIIQNVDHLPEWIMDNFKKEIELRCSGDYENVEEYY